MSTLAEAFATGGEQAGYSLLQLPDGQPDVAALVDHRGATIVGLRLGETALLGGVTAETDWSKLEAADQTASQQLGAAASYVLAPIPDYVKLHDDTDFGDNREIDYADISNNGFDQPALRLLAGLRDPAATIRHLRSIALHDTGITTTDTISNTASRNEADATKIQFKVGNHFAMPVSEASLADLQVAAVPPSVTPPRLQPIRRPPANTAGGVLSGQIVAIADCNGSVRLQFAGGNQLTVETAARQSRRGSNITARIVLQHIPNSGYLCVQTMLTARIVPQPEMYMLLVRPQTLSPGGFAELTTRLSWDRLV